MTDELLSAALNPDLTEAGGGHNNEGIDFQRAWSICRIFELEDMGAKDYVILYECIQDVAELDSATASTHVRVYQVKKKGKGAWTWGELTGLHAPDAKKPKPFESVRKSPLGKLHATIGAFSELDATGHFISNAGSFASKSVCTLHDVDPSQLQLLTAAFDSVYGKAQLSRLHLHRIALPPDDIGTYVLGRAATFLASRSPPHIAKVQSFVEALLAAIGPLSRSTDPPVSRSDLIAARGYSRSQFLKALGALEEIRDLRAALKDAYLGLLQDGFAYLDVERIKTTVAAEFSRRLTGERTSDSVAAIEALDRWLDEQPPMKSLGAHLREAHQFVRREYPAIGEHEAYALCLIRMLERCVDQT